MSTATAFAFFKELFETLGEDERIRVFGLPGILNEGEEITPDTWQNLAGVLLELGKFEDVRSIAEMVAQDIRDAYAATEIFLWLYEKTVNPEDLAKASEQALREKDASMGLIVLTQVFRVSQSPEILEAAVKIVEAWEDFSYGDWEYFEEVVQFLISQNKTRRAIELTRAVKDFNIRALLQEKVLDIIYPLVQ